ncbi:BMP family ABC transporter substrate-binding protein [Celeribacter halophilus]|uniref:BMP family ABC transporter substrate-binding protein n=1 Tax=Celeribacter halophilus TaxID=576117 RepID=A0AAW7XVI8_9RHOB|nr:BMP family ABC transporter substrate-binding protein [Celeribacter halophilus]MDO6458020.1 BMP family ABC transporter substrate-binding protein [Celeribacter halophilus]
MPINMTRRHAAQLLLASTLGVAVAPYALLAQDKLKVALVLHGTLGDKSFLDSAAAGMARAEEELGIEATIIEASNDRSRWQPALADACDQGFDVIICGTWEMSGFMQELAPEYPDTKFILFDDAPDFSAGDFSNILGLTYQTSTAAYLAGYAAAKVSKTGKIGEILGVEGTTILEFAVGFEQGAKAANPDIEVVRAVAGTFTDPAKGKELALAQFAQGVDVVFPIAGGTGIGALQAARDEGLLGVGVDSDQAAIFADTDPAQSEVILTSVEKKVGDSLVSVLEQTIAGTAPYGSALLLGLSDGAVGISKNSYYEALVPEDVRAEIEAVEAQIIAGEIDVETVMQ